MTARAFEKIAAELRAALAFVETKGDRIRLRDPDDNLVGFSFKKWFVLYTPKAEFPGHMNRADYIAGMLSSDSKHE